MEPEQEIPSDECTNTYSKKGYFKEVAEWEAAHGKEIYLAKPALPGWLKSE